MRREKGIREHKKIKVKYILYYDAMQIAFFHLHLFFFTSFNMDMVKNRKFLYHFLELKLKIF